MQFQHIVSGDMAAASLKTALNLAHADIVNMDDDLSVGPLADVDAAAPIHRAAFRRLAADNRPCLVWCGTGANEQLTLRRTAHFLQKPGRALWVVSIGPNDQ